MMTVKICRKCKIAQPFENYYAYKNTSKIYSACKGCCSKSNKAWKSANPDRVKLSNQQRGTQWTIAARSKYALSEREKHDSYLWRSYGITLDQYEEMLKAQNGVCAICKDECNRKTTKRLCVDHDHITGVVRGLLCFQCNVGVGKFKDSPAIMTVAAQYMVQHESRQSKPVCEAA